MLRARSLVVDPGHATPVKTALQSIGLLLAAIGISGCSSQSQRVSPASGSILAQNAIEVGATTITVAAISRGTDFRLVQWSKAVSLEAELHQSGGKAIAAARLGDNGEWFTGHNLTATLSADERWVFLFRRFDPPIEGRSVFRPDLGEHGGWCMISKRDLPADQVLQYGYYLVGAVDLQQNAILTREALVAPDSQPLLTQATVVLAGVEVAAEEIPVKPSRLPSPSGK